MTEQINPGSINITSANASAASALIGDPSKAEKVLGWKAKTDWKALAKLMVDADLEKAKSKSN